MGFTPSDVKQMSVFEYGAAVRGYLKAHDSGGGTTLSATEADEIWEWMKTKPATIH